MRTLRTVFAGFDPILFGAVLPLTLVGIATMYSYVGDNTLFYRQIAWIAIALFVFCVALIPDYRFLRTGHVSFYIYILSALALLFLLLFGEVTRGVQSRFDLGLFSVQPSDPAKIALILVLSKYFSKRHIEIAHFRHIFVSGIYAFFLFALVFLQPDFGSALIIFALWFGMVLVAGISLRHLALVTVVGVLAFGALWSFGFQDYQKERILTFLNPLADLEGAGYNAYQSTIAVGSGQFFGKGVGYGTQSKLQFLPEYETDFIFAAFAEEWGFLGITFLFVLFAVLVWRILRSALLAHSNFERLFCVGVVLYIVSHFFIHIGMNIGLLPVTGITLPFLSYGGSHLVTEFFAIGVVMAMNKRRGSGGSPTQRG